jgi:hypothetical protein
VTARLGDRRYFNGSSFDRRILRVVFSSAIGTLGGAVTMGVFTAINANGLSIPAFFISVFFAFVIPIPLIAVITTFVEVMCGFARMRRNLQSFLVAFLIAAIFGLPFIQRAFTEEYWEGTSMPFAAYGFVTALAWWWLLPENERDQNA